MAVSNAAVFAGTDYKTFDVTATADADTTATIAHGFGAAPAEVSLRPLLANHYVSQWTVSAVDATNITLTKGTGVGSGNAGAQVRVQARRPHSIGA